jgi:Na+/proline symporter
MSETTSTAAATAHSSGKVSVPLVIGSAVLVGIGLTGMAYWLITFHWILLASVLPLATGGLLFFTKATGPDHA